MKIIVCFLFLLSPFGVYSKNYDIKNIDSLKGIWIVSYTVDGRQYTDKLVIDGSTTIFGDIQGTGTLYLGQSDKNTRKLLCVYDPYNLSLPAIDSFSIPAIKIDYNCTSNSPYNIYEFKFDYNTITSGLYGFGDNLQDVVLQIISRKYNLTGYRLSNYRSDYDLIQWDKRVSDNEYCIDIMDDNWNFYQGGQALRCGANMANFSPIDFVKNVLHTTLPRGFVFRWKVFSRNANSEGKTIGTPNYGGQGYEGRVVVP